MQVRLRAASSADAGMYRMSAWSRRNHFEMCRHIFSIVGQANDAPRCTLGYDEKETAASTLHDDEGKHGFSASSG
jgi:hypothetical protein